MRDFRPVRLNRSLERVREKHPTRYSALQRGDDLTGDVAVHLLAKIRSATDADELVRSLNQLERQLFGWFARHDEENVRRRVRYVAHEHPTAVTTAQLWVAFLFEPEDAAVAQLKELLSRRPHELNRLQATLVQSQGEANWFREVVRLRLGLKEAFEHANVRPSPLRTRMQRYGVATGELDVWRLYEVIEVRRQLAAQGLEDFAGTCTRFWRSQGKLPLQMLVDEAAVLALADTVATRDGVNEWVSAEVAQFLHRLVMFAELRSFFKGDNERFDYWSGYLDAMRKVHVEEEEQRLFMDFGRVGVIEFGQVGNAAYVYESEYFTRMVERSKSRKLSHDDLKNKDRVLERIIHGSRWQQKADRKMAKLGVSRGLV